MAEHPDFEDFQVSHEGGWPCAEAYLLAGTQLSEPVETPTTPALPEVRGPSPTGCKIFTYWEYEVGSKAI